MIEPDSDSTADMAALIRAVKEASRPLPLLFDADGAAAFVGISRSAVYRLTSAGTLRQVDVAGVGPRWRRHELESYVGRLKPARRSRRVRATETAGLVGG